jgi:hypothetical protein
MATITQHSPLDGILRFISMIRRDAWEHLRERGAPTLRVFTAVMLVRAAGCGSC